MKSTVQNDQTVVFFSRVFSEVSRQTLKISPVIFGINRSFKRQNTTSLKLVFIKVSVMLGFACFKVSCRKCDVESVPVKCQSRFHDRSVVSHVLIQA